MPAGKGSIYALTNDGTLEWYRNDTSWNTVGGEPGSPNWKGPINVGSGWQQFTRIVPAADGILYAINSNGTLKWYRHNGYMDGSMNWSGPIDVTPNQRSPFGPRFDLDWGNFKQVFSGGEGVMYAITNDGTLVWYHHRGYLTGTREWDGPRNVGTGWADFTRVFSPGDGVIYAMKPTGEMLWYKHVGYEDGSVSWQGPVEIAADWKDFIFVFPGMTGTWTPPVIH
jgi:Tachylectin